VLDAAASLVLRDGVGELTLERVAQEAGVSKGGLLYHFPTKVELVEALVEDILDRFERAVDDRAARSADRMAWAHAYVDATFDAEVSRPALGAALVTAPDLGGQVLRRCADRLATWQTRLEDEGVDPATAAAVRYACDGWWTLSTLIADGTDVEPLRARLHRMLEETPS
jgi:AcrR family transcriptional regulator